MTANIGPEGLQLQNSVIPDHFGVLWLLQTHQFEINGSKKKLKKSTKGQWTNLAIRKTDWNPESLVSI